MSVADESIHALRRDVRELEEAVATAAPLLRARLSERSRRLLQRADGWLHGQARALLERGASLQASPTTGNGRNHALHLYDHEVRHARRELNQLTAGVREAYAAATRDILLEMDDSRKTFDAVFERAQHTWSTAQELVAQLADVYGDTEAPPPGLAAPLRELLLALQAQKSQRPEGAVAADFADAERCVRTRFDPAELVRCREATEHLLKSVEPVEHALARVRAAHDAALENLTAADVLDDKEKAEREFEHAASVAAGTVRLLADAATALEHHFEQLSGLDVPVETFTPLAQSLENAKWHDVVVEAIEWADRSTTVLDFRQPRCDGGTLTVDSLRKLVSTVLSWLGLSGAPDVDEAARAFLSAAEDFESRAMRAIAAATRVSVRAARLAASHHSGCPSAPISAEDAASSTPAMRNMPLGVPRTAGDVRAVAGRLFAKQEAAEATLSTLADRLSLAREKVSLAAECSLTRAAELAIESRLADSHIVELAVRIKGLVGQLESATPLRDPQAALEWLTLYCNALQRHEVRGLSIANEIRDALAVIDEDVAHGAGWQPRDWDLVCSAPRQARAILQGRQRLQQRRKDNALAMVRACRESEATLAAWLELCRLAAPRDLRDLDAQLRVTMTDTRHPARRVAMVQGKLDAALSRAESASCKQLSVAWASIERKAWKDAAVVARSRRKRKLSAICEARASAVLAVETVRRKDIQSLSEVRSFDEIPERPWSCVPTVRPLVEAAIATAATQQDDMLSFVIDDDVRNVLRKAATIGHATTPPSEPTSSESTQLGTNEAEQPDEENEFISTVWGKIPAIPR